MWLKDLDFFILEIFKNVFENKQRQYLLIFRLYILCYHGAFVL